MKNTPKFKKGWVYTYDKYGIISKRLIRTISINPLYYQLTGDPNYHWKENEMFLRKKDCQQAMKEAGIKENTLQQATILILEEKIEELSKTPKRLAIDKLKEIKEIMSKCDNYGYMIRFASMADREKFNKLIDEQIKDLGGDINKNNKVYNGGEIKQLKTK